MKLPFVSRKRLESALALANECFKSAQESSRAWRFREKEYQNVIGEFRRLFGSPNGKVVLGDLEAALNAIREYERMLGMLNAPDTNRIESRKLLRKWGMEPGNLDSPLFGFSPGAATKAEEEKWGDEAYSISKVRIMAERTEDGDRLWLEDVDGCQIDLTSQDEGS